MKTSQWAERYRPESFEQVVGQTNAVSLLKGFHNKGFLPHIVFHGPPGCGKTTLGTLLARIFDVPFAEMNATTCSVKDLRSYAEQMNMGGRILFLDEIHRLNKAQQDVLLPYTEKSVFTLIGSTTENPMFALNKALRSRVQLIRLDQLSSEEIKASLASVAQKEEAEAEEEALDWISKRVSGDMRQAIGVLESAHAMAQAANKPIAVEHVAYCLESVTIAHDRDGDAHYDLASAYQKSMRGSDPDAAIYYLTRFLAGGEDPRFIARRLLVTAAEDVGNADPMAFLIASQAFRAVEILGMPEAKIPLSQATLYVARAPKSNESIKALGEAGKLLQSRPLDPIPAHLRDSHYSGAKAMGHGAGYVYSHGNEHITQSFLPEELVGTTFTQSAKLDPNAVEKLMICLTEKAKDWFEVDMQFLAGETGLDKTSLRKALNSAVAKGLLEFKKTVRVKSKKD